MRKCPICWLISKFKKNSIHRDFTKAPVEYCQRFFLQETEEELALWDSLPPEERWHLGTGPPERQAALLKKKKS